MEEINDIDFAFLDSEEKRFTHSVMIVFNVDFDKEQFLLFRAKSDYVICVDEAVNRLHAMFDQSSSDKIEELVDCVLYNEGNEFTEAVRLLKNHSKKFILKSEESSSDLNKCLYYSLENISEKGNYDFRSNGMSKFNAIFILGVGEKFDETYIILQSVNQYLNTVCSLNNTEFYLVSQSSMFVFLKNGENVVTTSTKWEDRKQGYGVLPLQDNISVKISEYKLNQKKFELNKNLKFASVVFRKNFDGDKIRLGINGIKNGFVIYSVTSIFHKE